MEDIYILLQRHLGGAALGFLYPLASIAVNIQRGHSHGISVWQHT